MRLINIIPPAVEEGGLRVSVVSTYLPVVQLPVDVDLALCDVTGQIRNRMSDVYRNDFTSTRRGIDVGNKLAVVGHGQNRNLRDGSISPLHTSGTLKARSL